MTEVPGTSEKAKPKPIRAAIYCRISEDPRGLERGVRRQDEDCQALADRRGWQVVATFTDNDVSALKGQQRSGYKAMMASAQQGEIDWIVAYGLSRLWRNRRERADGIEALSQAQVGVALVKGSDIDLTDAAGRMYAGILGEFDTAESEIKAERVARAASQRAQEGRANGQCAYGWKRVYQRDEQGRVLSWEDVVDEPTAEVVRGIVSDLLAGATLRSVTARLNDEGKLSPLGKRWIPSSVRKLALRDLNIGVRTHLDQTYEGVWAPIVDEEQHMRVKVLLNDPRRRTQKAASRSHLLTFGIGSCGVCQGVLAVAKKGPPGKKTALYVCRELGCVGRREEWVDELVIRAVCYRLDHPEAGPIFRSEVEKPSLEEALRRVDELTRRLDEAADACANGDIELRQLTRITAKLRPELEAAKQLAQASPAVPEFVEKLLTAPDKREAWDGLSLTQQRLALEVLGVDVIVKRARGGPGFKEESVEVTWAADRAGSQA